MEMLSYIRAVKRQYDRMPEYTGPKFVYMTDFEAIELLEDLRAENPLIDEAALEAALNNDDPWSLLGDEVTTVYGLTVRRYGT